MVQIKRSVFKDTTLSSPLKVNVLEEHLHFQGWKICQARNQVVSRALCLFFNSEDEGNTFLQDIGSLSMDHLVHTPENRNLHKHCCENPFSCIWNALKDTLMS